MTSHDALHWRTSRVTSLQRLKLEALIPTSADCEVRSVMKFLIAQNIAPIEIHRLLCQDYGHTRLDVNTSAGVRLGGAYIIIHPISPGHAPSYLYLFLQLKEFLFGQRFQNDREADLLRSFKVCSDAKERVECGKHLFIPSETATLVPEFAVEDLPLGRTAALVPEFTGKTCPWAEHSDDDENTILVVRRRR